jgi:energy-coupling factor transport system permease protein
MIYRRRRSALHAARAGAGAGYCLGLALAALMLGHPVALGAVTLAILIAGWLAGSGRALARSLRFAVPVGLAVMVINALVDRNGLTVIVRLGQLPVLGHTDVTLEATVAGAVLGLRAVALILVGSLYTVAVDPDEMLRLMRRVSLASALTAGLATRMVPVLARDGRRMADARRCRPGRPPARVALLRAASSGMLDRALDLAAALEVRGYALAGAGRPPRRPLSRHDLAIGAAAVTVPALALLGRLGGAAAFAAEPALHFAAGPATWALSGALIVAALLPFAQRRGCE